MSSMKGKILRLLSGVALSRASIVEAQDIGGFRRLVLRGSFPAFSAGAKIQILLPSDDARTYTPIPSPDGFTLLGWKHAGGPGAKWIASATIGEEVLFVGPQRSLELAPGPVVLVGDETSVAVAAAFEVERPGQVQAIIQSDAAEDIRAAAAAVGLTKLSVVARGDSDATTLRVASSLSTNPRANVALTGSSELIVAVRGALRAAKINDIKTKTYWIPGKAGLD